MKIVIIEDEDLVAEDLFLTLKQIRPDIELMASLRSVKESIEYFSHNPSPDLIFSDIQLGDGLSFEISNSIEINVPIIFCTAFDNYAIKAFKTNGIDYVLKPYYKASLEKALSKFDGLKTMLVKDIQHQYNVAMQTLQNYQLKESGTFMIKYRDRFLPIDLNKIVLFYIENEINHLVTHTGKIYYIPESLEETENKVSSDFFRINRQFLVNRNMIEDATEYFPRKLKINLKIPFDKEIIASKEKRKKILEWLQQ
ncbi:LytTR family DNA-binding domain-containing protein [Chryseobacterium sp.]|uniref:LytR/AlgR family response regulator transcription factor n=1 Tax=Chryseobacterium sp. TaxID=1871047 RepID=UPI0025BF2E82|nr:LytTR family DNA-binding domain-containing protein [Chryseobacterium sp.]